MTLKLTCCFMFIFQKMLSNIPTNNIYYLKIAGSSKSIYSQDYFDGNFSKEVVFGLEGEHFTFEPQQDETSKMTCAPSEDSDQPGHPPSLIRVFAVHFLGS